MNRLLTSLTEPAPPPPVARRRRVLVLTVSTVGSIVLFPWVVFLIFTLSERPQGGEWWLAWAGFDVALAAALGCTAVFGWLRRQFVLFPLIVTGVLLCCDAWFDITLSWGTDESWVSFATAFLIELPLAVLMFRAAHGISTSTVHHVRRREGRDGTVPPLHTLPMNLEAPEPET